MKEIKKTDFDNVSLPDKKTDSSVAVRDAIFEVTGFSPEELAELELKAGNPVGLQKSLVAKLAAYVDYMIAKDLRELKAISDYTRRFIELYNSILTNLQREIYGEKTVSLGSVKVTHSMIMGEVRKYSKVVDAEFTEEKSKDG